VDRVSGGDDALRARRVLLGRLRVTGGRVVNTLLRGRSRDRIRGCPSVEFRGSRSIIGLFTSAKAGGEEGGKDDIFIS